MCGPRIKAQLSQAGVEAPTVNRRHLLKAGAAAAVGGVALMAGSTPVSAASNGRHRRVHDLTYRLTTDFPTFFGDDAGGARSTLFDYGTDGFYIQQWNFQEQWGTHMDAPGHFGPEAWKVDQIPVEHLVAPLAVVNIAAKAMGEPNATVEVDDLVAYERRHGRIPRGAFVAMNSGWEAKRAGGNDAYRGGVGFPDLNFPGFGIEAAMWLAEQRNVVGIGVDTLSLDPGNSADFAVHFGFLPTNRYGIENLARLDQVPARGATVIVGAVPWQDGSGGPSRVLAIG
ncbi:MAG: cyclase family protein [Acidimicrobiia bacterium]|nr:cyclase family protein [Acidimicrobiia bacterium]